MSQVMRLLMYAAVATIVLTFICIGLMGCAYTPKDNIFFGWGHCKRNDEGKVIELESRPPLEIFQPTLEH